MHIAMPERAVLDEAMRAVAHIRHGKYYLGIDNGILGVVHAWDAQPRYSQGGSCRWGGYRAGWKKLEVAS